MRVKFYDWLFGTKPIIKNEDKQNVYQAFVTYELKNGEKVEYHLVGMEQEFFDPYKYIKDSISTVIEHGTRVGFFKKNDTYYPMNRVEKITYRIEDYFI